MFFYREFCGWIATSLEFSILASLECALQSTMAYSRSIHHCWLGKLGQRHSNCCHLNWIACIVDIALLSLTAILNVFKKIILWFRIVQKKSYCVHECMEREQRSTYLSSKANIRHWRNNLNFKFPCKKSRHMVNVCLTFRNWQTIFQSGCIIV